MSDFVPFVPDAHGDRALSPAIRAVTGRDLPGLATLLAARGGVEVDHVAHAERLFARAPILLVAELPEKGIVAWSGAHRTLVSPALGSQWIVAGLTVLPSVRRRGVGLELLRAVTTGVARRDPDATLYSVVNARNPASIVLHGRAGFIEVERGPVFAGVAFDGGDGVLLAHNPSGGVWEV